jgi:hypothetical protein
MAVKFGVLFLCKRTGIKEILHKDFIFEVINWMTAVRCIYVDELQQRIVSA